MKTYSSNILTGVSSQHVTFASIRSDNSTWNRSLHFTAVDQKVVAFKQWSKRIVRNSLELFSNFDVIHNHLLVSLVAGSLKESMRITHCMIYHYRYIIKWFHRVGFEG